MARKAQELMMRFLEEFRCRAYRNIYLENSIIDTLLEYLLRKQTDPATIAA